MNINYFMALSENPNPQEKPKEPKGWRARISGIIDSVRGSLKKAALDPEDVQGHKLLKRMQDSGMAADIIDDFIRSRNLVFREEKEEVSERKSQVQRTAEEKMKSRREKYRNEIPEGAEIKILRDIDFQIPPQRLYFADHTESALIGETIIAVKDGKIVKVLAKELSSMTLMLETDLDQALEKLFELGLIESFCGYEPSPVGEEGMEEHGEVVLSVEALNEAISQGKVTFSLDEGGDGAEIKIV